MGDGDQTNVKTIINSKLTKIKQEKNTELSQSLSSYDSDNEDNVDPSQLIRPQRFFQDLDSALHNKTKEEYISEILRLCGEDSDAVNDYRKRLAERAGGFPDCPGGRLVARRNSAHATKLMKLANDCYTICMFNNGTRSKEVYEVFSSVYINLGDNEINNKNGEPESEAKTNDLQTVNTVSILLTMRDDIAEIKIKQSSENARQECILNELRSISTNTNLIHAKVNSMLSRQGGEREQQDVMLRQLQSEILDLGEATKLLGVSLNGIARSSGNQQSLATQHQTQMQQIREQQQRQQDQQREQQQHHHQQQHQQ